MTVGLRMAILTGLMFLAGCAATTPLSQTDASVPLEPGRTFIYDNGRVETFVAAGPGETVWKTRTGNRYRRHEAGFVPILEWSMARSSGRRTVIGDPGALWPPVPGRSTRFTLVEDVREPSPRRAVQHWRCAVGAMRSVTVPAGAFETVPVTCAQYSAYSMRPLRERVWDYAPALGHYVQAETRSLLTGRTVRFGLQSALDPADATRTRVRRLVAEIARNAADASTE